MYSVNIFQQISNSRNKTFKSIHQQLYLLLLKMLRVSGMYEYNNVLPLHLACLNLG